MDDIPAPLPSNPTRFMDRFRAFIRVRHLAYRTEKTHVVGTHERGISSPLDAHASGFSL